MPAVNLAPYDAQMAELDRRQRIAQALAAAGAEQQDVPAYKGISAMPSRAGMLANVLKSFVGARQERNIGRDRMALGKEDAAAAAQFGKQSLADLLAASSPQAAAPAQPPAAPPQAAPAATPQDASGLPWGAVAQGEAPQGWFDGQQAAPAGGSYNPPSGAGLTGVATNPDTLAAAMGGAAPQAAPAPQAKVPGGNSSPPAMTLDQLQATIAAGLASPYPSVRAQAQAMMPMVNQRLGRQQQVAERDEGRAYAQSQSDRTKKDANELGQSLLASIPNGTPDNVRFAVEAHIRIGDLDGAAKVLGDAVGGGGRKLVHSYDPYTRSYVWVFETPQGLVDPGSVSIPNINPSDVDWH